jgi:hypothetical protein
MKCLSIAVFCLFILEFVNLDTSVITSTYVFKVIFIFIGGVFSLASFFDSLDKEEIDDEDYN